MDFTVQRNNKKRRRKSVFFPFKKKTCSFSFKYPVNAREKILLIEAWSCMHHQWNGVDFASSALEE